MLDEFLTAAETAILLDKTEGTLRWMRCKGKGPAYAKKGKFVLYARSEIGAYLKEKERGASGTTRMRP
ncbi:helix-turn-helix domain-containing protein [Novosphingobium sp. Leaf2]|uniref:helix-turn-helix domain-containing protein n=1 Tax=Novosphingobium sp. Leaf2 TaxID=1735670 RepID=UPI0007153B72|nr:helix-turn-helix domain-containing protein [Novosphingobium sp. Leaf2]KQM12989.1 hypothetical protein ASE49_13395 [Novosphingobium sp. Leaf2]